MIFTISVFMKMQNGDIAFIEPVFECINNGGKVCTIVDGEVLFTHNNIKVLLKSEALYGWILVGWKYESYGAHHGDVLYDRNHITLSDTPENGFNITKVS